jgi:hypothetical protein
MTSKAIIIYSRPLRLGAQEKDTISGIKLFSSMFEKIIEVTIDFSNEDICTISKNDAPTFYKKSYRNLLSLYMKFFLCKLLICDPALRQVIRLNYFKFVQYLSLMHPNSVVIAENSNLLPLSFFFRYRVLRSHNFEPVHAFREQKNTLLGIIYFVIKIQSVILERLFTKILSISERDAGYYKLIPSANRILVLPLRDLILKTSARNSMEPFGQLDKNVAYLSSTYNVFHNHKGLNFFANEVFNSLELKDIKLNIYGSKAPDLNYGQNVKKHGWVQDLDEIYLENQVFLCFSGGTGQQSKIFEPLLYGKILICNPRLLVGHELLPEIHYLAAETSSEFRSQILRVFGTGENFDKLRQNAFEYCQIHFSYYKNLINLNNFIKF